MAASLPPLFFGNVEATESKFQPLNLTFDHTKRTTFDEGANVRARDQLQETPLHVAAGLRMAAAVDVLIEAGADVNAVSNVNRSTPLHDAVQTIRAYRSVEGLRVVRALIENGANVNAKTTAGETALEIARRMPGMRRDDPLLQVLRDAAKKNAPF